MSEETTVGMLMVDLKCENSSTSSSAIETATRLLREEITKS